MTTATPEADLLATAWRNEAAAVLIHPSLGLAGLHDQMLTRAIRLAGERQDPPPDSDGGGPDVKTDPIPDRDVQGVEDLDPEAEKRP